MSAFTLELDEREIRALVDSLYAAHSLGVFDALLNRLADVDADRYENYRVGLAGASAKIGTALVRGARDLGEAIPADTLVELGGLHAQVDQSRADLEAGR
jgi:hypothetical protein